MSEPTPTTERGRWAAPLLLAVLAVAAGKRLPGLGRDSLTTDEIYIVSRAGGDLSTLLDRVGETVMGAPVEFLVRHAMLALSGAEWVLRLPDAIAGIAAVGILHRLSSRLFDPATGFVASLLLAVAGLHVHHSQDARYYSLFCLLALLSTHLLLRALENGRAGWWVAYAATMILGVYNCYFTAIVGLVHAAFVFAPFVVPSMERIPPTRVVGFVASGVATVLAFAPWVASYRPVPNIPHPPTGLATAMRTMSSEFAGGRGAIEVAFVFLFAAGLVRALGTRRPSGLLCGLFVLLPFPLIWMLDQHFHYFFAARQVIFALPFYLALVAYGAIGIAGAAGNRLPGPRWWPGAALVAAVAVLTATAEPTTQSNNRAWLHEDWRGTAVHLLGRMQPGDVLVMSHLPFGPPDGDNVGYYLRALGPDPAPWQVMDSAGMAPETLGAMARRGRVWFVAASRSHAGQRPALLEELERDFTREAAFHGGILFGEIRVYRSRDAGSGSVPRITS